MSNLDISFFGADAKQLMDENPDVVRQINRYFERQANDAIVRIYVYPRSLYDSKLEWAGVITSPAGRYTLTIKQRILAGAITFEPVSNYELETSPQRIRPSQWFPGATTHQ
jgi:hypothetical protein